MKNKLLIGLITFFAAFATNIAILNFSSSSSKKNYSFEREFSSKELLKLDKEFEKLNKNSNIDLFGSDKNYIIEGVKNKKIKSAKEDNYDLYYSDLSFVKKHTKNVKLPLNSNIKLLDSQSIFFTLNSGKELYKLNLKNNETIYLDINKLTIFSIISLDEQQSNYLFIGNIYKNNEYKTGFFKLNTFSKKITEIRIIETNNHSFNPKKELEFSGFFQKIEDDIISFTCDKNANIFLFDKKGNFKKKLVTKDNTPLPKVIINSKKDMFYSRNGLHFSNQGIFSDKNYIYVFSMATNSKEFIVIDQYSKENSSYIKSYKLYYKKLFTNYIQTIIKYNNNLILKFENNYASFKF